MERMEDLQVKDLINKDATTWDATMIRGIFCDIGADRILRIPLPRVNCHDRLLWTETMNGYYSVKTRYRLAVQHIRPSLAMEESMMRRQIWRMHIPPKYRESLWRACNGIFPSRDSLLQRGMVVLENCVSCTERETILHALLFCRNASQCWETYGHVLEGDGLPEILKSLLHGPQSIFEEACSIMWHISKARNFWNWEQKRLPPTVVVNNSMRETYKIGRELWLNLDKMIGKAYW
ncbi:uncharacterized protein [Rutidosis leptorrhynchoides]|uniref:uncharacterized protein n=1 Tax=Rutidosis leptorrhynchoides TaxID=125765 RepID=UPI003A99725D